MPSGIAALDEYGIPLQTGIRISRALRDATDLDTAIAALRDLDVESLPISEFERDLVADAQRFV
jgi:hypothetical protein